MNLEIRELHTTETTKLAILTILSYEQTMFKELIDFGVIDGEIIKVLYPDNSFDYVVVGEIKPHEMCLFLLVG